MHLSHPFILALIVSATMLAFAGNSLLTRAALDGDLIGPEAFTLVRLLSGALCLAALMWLRNDGLFSSWSSKTWQSGRLYALGGGASLLIYALAFTFAYAHLSAGLGALILFGLVQLTLIAVALARGEAFGALQALATLLAFSGLIVLLSGGEMRGNLWSGGLMALAGIAWGLQTALGQRAAQSPTATMALNFLLASLMALPLLLPGSLAGWTEGTAQGLGLAMASGALASGLGYALWYAVLPHMSAMLAGVSQLTVPLITAILGLLWLQEPLSWRLIIAAGLISVGVIIVIRDQTKG